MTPYIRWMIRRDMTEVLAIENDSYAMPWTEDDFIRCLRQRNCIGMVAVHPETEAILGYMLYDLLKSNLTLLNIAVRRDVRRTGVGRAMLEKLVGKLSAARRTKIDLVCADWNYPAHIFFRACGFRATKVVHDFYEHDDCDAYQFERKLEIQHAMTR